MQLLCYQHFLTSIVLSGMIIFPKAWRSVKKFHLDMNVLMTIAVIGAVFIKEYSEAASVVFLFSLAELLEALSVSRARRAIKEVLKLTPREALVIENDKMVSTDVSCMGFGRALVGVCNRVGRSALAQAPSIPTQTELSVRYAIVRL